MSPQLVSVLANAGLVIKPWASDHEPGHVVKPCLAIVSSAEKSE